MKRMPLARHDGAAINLLDPKYAEVVVATHDAWLNTIDGKEESTRHAPGSWAVFGFKGERTALFDTFAIFSNER